MARHVVVQCSCVKSVKPFQCYYKHSVTASDVPISRVVCTLLGEANASDFFGVVDGSSE